MVYNYYHMTYSDHMILFDHMTFCYCFTESSMNIVHKLISLIKEAVELRKEKAYPVSSDNKKTK